LGRAASFISTAEFLCEEHLGEIPERGENIGLLVVVLSCIYIFLENSVRAYSSEAGLKILITLGKIAKSGGTDFV